MLRARFLAAAVLFAAGSFSAGAQAQDCGNVTLQGECDGTTLRYCSQDTLVEVDCDTLDGQAPAGTATCGEIDAEWGFDCMFTDGQACQGEDFVAFCQDGSGCTVDLDAQQATCTATGTCTPDENFAAVCNGDTLTLDCNRGQPYSLACPGASTCTNGTCTGSALGEPCDDQVIFCGANLTCNATTGVCEDGTTPPTDGGVPAGCGDVPPEGICNGNTVQVCDEATDELIEVDCGAYYPDTTATCGIFGGFANCLLPDDATCVYAVGEPPENRVFPCEDGSGCVIGDQGATCVGGLGTCTEPAQGEDYAAVCIGNALNYACFGGQPLSFDCPGSCSGGTCVGGAAGDFCDDTQFLCADGLVCEANTCAGVAADGGVIDPPPSDGGTDPVDPIDPNDGDGGVPPIRPEPDAGTPDDDAGTPDDDAGTAEPDASPDTPSPDTPSPDTPSPDTPSPDTPEPGAQPDTPEPGAQPDTPEPGAQPDPQPTLEPAASPEPEDDPGEDPPASNCSHTSAPAQSGAFTGLFAALFLGLAVRRRRR